MSINLVFMRSSGFVLYFFTLLSVPGISQDWNTLYGQSKQAYEAGQYEQALITAEKAYEVSKNADAKTCAYSLQLITSICTDGQLSEKGLAYAEEEIKKFLELEGEQGKHYYEALQKQIRLLHQSNRLEQASKKNEALNNLAIRNFGSESYEYYSACFSYAQLLMELGSFRHSQETWTTCLPKLKQFPEASEDYFYGLYYAAYTDYKLGEWSRALEKWLTFISIAQQNKLENLEEYTEAKKFINELQGKLNSNASITADAGSLQQHLAIALDYQNKKQWDKAASQFSIAEQKINADNFYSNPAFSHYLNFGTLLYQRNKYDSAHLKLKEAKKIAAKLFPDNALEHGYIIYLEADLKLVAGFPAEAKPLYINAIDKLIAAGSELQATYVCNAARGMLAADRPDFALEVLEKKINDAKDLSEKSQQNLVTLYCDAHCALQQYDIAIKYLRDRTKAATANSLLFQIKLSEILKESGQWHESVEMLTSILKTTDLPIAIKAEAAYQLASTQQLLGKYVAAEENYINALEFYRQSKSGEHISEVSNSLATFYTQLGNAEAAERIYTDLLKLAQPQSAFERTVKQNLASVYEQSGKLEIAKNLLEEVVAEEKKSAPTPEYGIVLQNLGAVYHKLGNHDKAKTCYEQALEIDKKFSGLQSPGYATKTANLAALYQETGNLHQSRQLFESSLKIRETTLGTRHPDYVFNQYNLAVLYQRANEFALALPLFRTVSAYYVSQIKELFPVMSEQEKTAFYNKIQKVTDAYLDFAIDYVEKDKNIAAELLDFRLQTKALLLNSSAIMRNRILDSKDPVLLSKFTDWLQTKEQLALIFSLPAQEQNARQSQADVLRQKANTLEKELSAKSGLFANVLEESKVTWRSVLMTLKPGEAAIEMIRLRLNSKNDSVVYAALVLKPGLQTPAIVIMPDGKKMETREFSYYRNTIRFMVANERSYSTYWKPLEPILSDVKTVYFSPDGIYNKLSALTLFDPATNQYLADRMAVRLVSNLKDLLNVNETKAGIPEATLIGFPDYLQGAAGTQNQLTASVDKTSQTYELVRGGIEALPGTKEEIEKISTLLKSNQWKVQTYLSAEATEEVVKAQQGPALLHIATHGFFIGQQKEDTNVSVGKNIFQAENNPLLRSGLMLTGAEKNLLQQLAGKPRENAEDGVLTAYEAMNINLQNTDLVVLSACETGAGEIRNGEGVYGLQRSFLVAGAGSLMMSLWKVNDDVTQELMVSFYNHLMKLKNKREAFHLAQLELKKKYPAPLHWGAFVMIGR